MHCFVFTPFLTFQDLFLLHKGGAIPHRGGGHRFQVRGHIIVNRFNIDRGFFNSRQISIILCLFRFISLLKNVNDKRRQLSGTVNGKPEYSERQKLAPSRLFHGILFEAIAYQILRVQILLFVLSFFLTDSVQFWLLKTSYPFIPQLTNRCCNVW